jgi:hypothetical protein
MYTLFTLNLLVTLQLFNTESTLYTKRKDGLQNGYLCVFIMYLQL